MALPPNIPTSFVPQAASSASHRSQNYLTSAFGILSYFIFCVVFALALGVFFYGGILKSSQSGKDAQLVAAEQGIDPATAENFVRLRDRLSSGESLLDNHVAFSEFFKALEIIVPTNVRFSTLHLAIDETGTVKVEGGGIARTFNSLAVASGAFARDGRIKNAIFSGIAVNPKDGSVSFSFSASLDPKIIAFSAQDANAAPTIAPTPTSTITASTTSTQATTSQKTKP